MKRQNNTNNKINRYNSNILSFDEAKIIHAIETSLLQNILTMENWVGTNNAKFLPAFFNNTDRPVIINGWIIKLIKKRK
jgi:hypothetical protein